MNKPFAETHPSLKGKEHYITEQIHHKDWKEINAPAEGETWFSQKRQIIRIPLPTEFTFKGISNNEPSRCLLNDTDVQRHTTDNTVLRAAIEEFFEEGPRDWNLNSETIFSYLKRKLVEKLGLDQDGDA